MIRAEAYGWRPPKKKRNDEEFRLHCVIADFVRLRAHPDLLWYHCPSGENRTAITGARLKRMGVRRGVPDLCFVLPDGRPAFIEIKAPGKYLDPDQKDIRDYCDRQRVLHAVVRSCSEAEDVLLSWEALKPQRTARAA